MRCIVRKLVMVTKSPTCKYEQLLWSFIWLKLMKSAIQTRTWNPIPVPGRLSGHSLWFWPGTVFESIKEVADYPIEVLFSDVGGTAGLILGMSFATVLGLIDIAIQWVIGDGPVGDRTLWPGQYFSIFKMPDGRTPRGRSSRESVL